MNAPFVISFEHYEFESELADLEYTSYDRTYPFLGGEPDWDFETRDEQFDSLGHQILTDDPTFHDLLQEARTKLGISETIPELISRDKHLDEALHYIMSIVGDDELSTSNSKFFGLLCMIMGVHISGIQVSWKDCGISDLVGNYAEGWIVLPPNAEASFEAVNRRNANQGVPYLLDPVRMKYLSPVRKQSEMENDLASKLTHLSEIAAWTDPSWFTYDYHQMALVFATVSFDYTSAQSFPYLHKTEGGCGGSPPYGNIDSAISGIFKYTRGRSIRAIVGVMAETVKIHLNEMKPAESFFLKSSHLAQMGDKRWLEYITAYRSLQSEGGLSRAETNSLLRALEGSQLPSEMLDLATDIEPANASIGVAISHLRNDGFIFTELDVKMLLNKRAKERAVFGTVPMRQVLQELEEEQRLFKTNHWKVLTEIAGSNREMRELTSNLLSSYEGEADDDKVRSIMRQYYTIRAESHNRFSSFMYSDTVKVFKASEVLTLLEKGDKPLRADFLQTEGIDKVVRSYDNDTISEKRRKESIVKWLSEDSLKTLLENPLPPGIGPDDSRLFFSIKRQVESNTSRKIFVILFTSDTRLGRLTEDYLATYARERQVTEPDFTIICSIITREQYLSVCLSGVAEMRMLRRGLESEGDTIKRIWDNLRKSDRRIPYWNFILGRPWYLPEDILTRIDTLARGTDRIRAFTRRTLYEVVCEYDYPNLDRGMELLTYHSSTNTIQSHGGGFLQRRTLAGMPGISWASYPVDDIRKWPDFSFGAKKSYTVDPHVIGQMARRLRIYKVRDRPIYDRVSSWRSNIPRVSTPQ
jgi:hypothetical protein